MPSPLTIISSQDNFLHEGAATSNYGTQTYIYITAYTSYCQRGILKFPISWGTDIPVGATITGATLSLYHYGDGVGDPSAMNCNICKVTRNDWNETQSTWNIFKTSNNWTSAGGDFVTSNPASGSAVFGTAPNWINVNVLAIVQDAQTNSIDVNVIAKFDTASEHTGDIEPRIYSREYTGDTSLRPKLVITYTSGWAHIVKFNGTLTNTVAKINGVAVANIAKINGVAV
jgi:hypothetical protein